MRAAQLTRPVRESVRNCVAASCFLHYQSDAAQRFADRSLSCAAGAAGQAPLGLTADCTTAFMYRELERDTNRRVRSYLARTGGKKGDLSRLWIARCYLHRRDDAHPYAQ